MLSIVKILIKLSGSQTCFYFNIIDVTHIYGVILISCVWLCKDYFYINVNLQQNSDTYVAITWNWNLNWNDEEKQFWKPSQKLKKTQTNFNSWHKLIAAGTCHGNMYVHRGFCAPLLHCNPCCCWPNSFIFISFFNCQQCISKRLSAA